MLFSMKLKFYQLLIFFFCSINFGLTQNCNDDDVNLGSNLSLCSGSAINLNANVSGVSNASSNISNYTWELIGQGVIQNETSSNYNFTLTNSTEGTYVVTVNFDNNYNCPSITDTIVVTVLQLSPGTISGNLMICDGSNPPAFTDTPGSTGSNISYQWQSSTNNTNWNDINGQTNATYNPGVIGNSIMYYRRLVIYNGPGNNNCQVASNVVSLQPVSGNLNITGPNSLCVNQGSTNPLTTTFSSTPNNLSPTYSWSGPNGFSSTILSPTLSSFNSNQAGTYTVTAIIPNVFSSTNNGLCQVTENVTINLNPVTPTFSIPATGCPGVSFTPTGFTPQAGMTYQWSISPSIGNSTGLNTATPTFLLNSGGTYTINVTATNPIGNCSLPSSTSNITIPVLSILKPTIKVGNTNYNTTSANPNTIAICTGISTSSALIINNGPSSNPIGTTYTYSFNSGPTNAIGVGVSNGAPISLNYGNNPLLMTANFNGCYQNVTVNVYSGSNPYVSLGTSNSIGLCLGDSLSISIDPIAPSGQANPPGTTYTLTYSDVTNSSIFPVIINDTTVIHIYNSTSCGASYPGGLYPSNTFYAKVTAQNFCGQTSSSVSPITVSNTPVADFTVTDSTICVGQTITAYNTGISGNVIGSSPPYDCTSEGKFYWTITGGVMGTNFNLTSGNLGAYNPNYLDGMGLPDYTDNGSSSIGINFITSGYYTISQTYYNSCGLKTKVRHICVINPPICQFTVNPQNGCSPLAVNINNSSVAPTCNGSPVPLNYVWTISNPITGTTATISSNTTQNPTLNFTNTTTTAQTFTVGLNVIPMEPAAPTIPFSTTLQTCPTTISLTGTVGSITSSSTGNWSATITGLTSTAGVFPGTIISATPGTGSIGTGGTYTVTSVTASTITYSASGGTAPIAGSITNIIRSITGTVGSITNLGNGNWSATISGLCSTAGISVGSIIYATNGTGSIGTGGIYTVTAVTTSSISYTAAGGTTPIAGTLSNIYIQSCTSTCTQVVTVYPEVNFTNPTTATLCSGATLGVNITTNVSSTYTWVATSNPNVSGESTTLQNGGIINDQLVNLTNSVQTVTYTVNATSIPALGSCTKTQTITVTLYPNVTLTDPADLVLCPGIAQPSITFVSNPSSGVTFSWTNNNTSIGLGAASTGSIPSFTPVNNTNSNVVATITVTPYWLSCAGTPQTFSITVKPMPTVADPADQTICLGATTNAVVFTSPTNVSGTVFNWTNTNSSIGLAASGTGDINAFTTTGAGTATITVTPTANGCSGASQSFTILVKPIPVISPITNQTVCAGSNTTLITFGSSVTGTTYSWVNSNASIGLSASGNSATIPSFLTTNTSNSAISGTITVTPTFNGCPGLPISFTITVNPRPTVDAIANQVICNGGLTNPVIFSSALNVAGTTFNWTNNTTSTGLASSGTGDINSFTAVNNGNTNLVSTITITPVAGGCNGITGSFTITVKPTPLINSIPNQSICAGTNSILVNPGSTTAGTTYSWTNSNPSIGLIAAGNGSIPVFVGQNSSNSSNIATITVTPTANGCVGNPLSFTITVKPIPTVDAITNQINCNGTVTTAVSFSSTFGVSGTTFTWTNSNSSIGLAASGSGNISSFNAINTTANSITSTITITPNANGCNGTPTTYTYTVNPTPSVSAIPNQVKCAGTQTNAVNFSSSPIVSGTQYNWANSTTSIGLGASGTGNISAFPTVNTGATPVVATITVTPTANNCSGNPISFTITVNPTPQVLNLNNLTVCPQAIVPANALTSNVAGSTYSWNVSNSNLGLTPISGTTNSIPGFTAINNSTSPVTGTVTITPSVLLNGVTCAGPPATYTITVNPKPIMTPYNPQLFVFCEATTATVNFNSNISSNMSYTWTNDNTAIGIGASGTSISPGAGLTFTAVNNSNQPLTSNFISTPFYTNNGVSCPGNPVSFAITINPLPDIIPLNSYTICATSTGSNLYSSLNPIVGLGTTYVWTNSNPAIGMISSGTGSNFFTATNTTLSPISGTVTVTPTYTNNNVACTGTPISFTITVTPMPTVNPIANQSLCVGSSTVAVQPTGNIPNTVFTWNNNNATTGLGLTGLGQIPSFIGLNPSNQPNVSTINVVPSFTYNNITCTGTAGQFGITINPTPILDTIIDYQVCSGGNVNVAFTSASNIIGTNYQWANTNANIGLSSTGNGNLSFSATNTSNTPITGQITVTPSYTNAGITCTGNPRTFNITVLPTPVASTISNQTLCSGNASNPINFSSNLIGTVFDWTNSNNTIGLGSNGTGTIPSFIGSNTTNQPMCLGNLMEICIGIAYISTPGNPCAPNNSESSPACGRSWSSNPQIVCI